MSDIADPAGSAGASPEPKPQFTPDNVVSGRRQRPWAKRIPKTKAGKPITPATKKEAEAHMKQIALEATKQIAAGKEIPAYVVEKHKHMTAAVRAHILSYLGEDIEAAKEEFAHEMLANAREMAQYLMRNYERFPPQVQAFLCSMFFDKAQAQTNKTATSARGAQVQIQVNQFGDGTVDKEALIAKITGQAFLGAQPATGPERK